MTGLVHFQGFDGFGQEYPEEHPPVYRSPFERRLVDRVKSRREIWRRAGASGTFPACASDTPATTATVAATPTVMACRLVILDIAHLRFLSPDLL